jgi:hypothetical protein
VRLIPAQFVKPYLKSNKNDFLDAEAIAEAVARQNMRFVPIKTDEQLDLQALHRVRDRLVQRRTAVINQIRPRTQLLQSGGGPYIINIAGVPPGRYMLHLWNESALPATLQTLTREVQIGETSRSLGTLRVPVTRAPPSRTRISTVRITTRPRRTILFTCSPKPVRAGAAGLPG